MSGSTQPAEEEGDYNPGIRGVITPTTEDRYIPFPKFEVRVSDLSIGIPIIGVPALVALFLGEGAILLLSLPVSIILTFLIIAASPSEMPAKLWAISGFKYILSPKRLYSASTEASPESRNEGGLANAVGFQSSARTQDLTGIKYGWPGAQVIMTKEGTMEAALEIKTPNMDLSDPSEWQSNQETAREGANEELNSHPLFKTHITTKQFDVSQITELLDERLKDPDVANRPILREAVKELRDHRPAKMEERGTQQIRYFAIVTVEPFEATTQYTGANTPLENLSEIAVVGPLLRRAAVLSGFYEEEQSTPDPEDPAVREEMVETLNDRVHAVRTEVFGDMDGYEARRLSTVECLILAARVWRGHDKSYDQFEGLVRQHPMPDAQTRFTSSEQGGQH